MCCVTPVSIVSTIQTYMLWCYPHMLGCLPNHAIHEVIWLQNSSKKQSSHQHSQDKANNEESH